jgi:hypothetical protein
LTLTGGRLAAFDIFVELYVNQSGYSYLNPFTIKINSGAPSGTKSINNPGTGASQLLASSMYPQAVKREQSFPPETVTTVTYEDGEPDCDFYLYVNDPFTIYLSKTQSLPSIYGVAIQSDISYPGMETIVFPFRLEKGDMVKFRGSRDSVNEYWPESEEYRIVSITDVTDSNGDLRKAILLDRQINLKLTDTGNVGGYIERYIFNKHVPDETNIILRYNPKANITQDGILFPYYIEQTAKDNSGNVIKSLKDQNLI